MLSAVWTHLRVLVAKWKLGRDMTKLCSHRISRLYKIVSKFSVANSPDLSPFLFTQPTRTRQNKTILSCPRRWCGLGLLLIFRLIEGRKLSWPEQTVGRLIRNLPQFYSDSVEIRMLIDLSDETMGPFCLLWHDVCHKGRTDLPDTLPYWRAKLAKTVVMITNDRHHIARWRPTVSSLRWLTEERQLCWLVGS